MATNSTLEANAANKAAKLVDEIYFEVLSDAIEEEATAANAAAKEAGEAALKAQEYSDDA